MGVQPPGPAREGFAPGPPPMVAVVKGVNPGVGRLPRTRAPQKCIAPPTLGCGRRKRRLRRWARYHDSGRERESIANCPTRGCGRRRSKPRHLGALPAEAIPSARETSAPERSRRRKAPSVLRPPPRLTVASAPAANSSSGTHLRRDDHPAQPLSRPYGRPRHRNLCRGSPPCAEAPRPRPTSARSQPRTHCGHNTGASPLPKGRRRTPDGR